MLLRPLILFVLLSISTATEAQNYVDSLLIIYQEQQDSEDKFQTLGRLLNAIETSDTNLLTTLLADGERLIRLFPNGKGGFEWYLFGNLTAIRSGNYETGYAYGLEAIEAARRLEKAELEVRAVYGAAYTLSEYDQQAAIPYYRRCIELSRLIGDSISLADCLIDYSDAFNYSEEYNDADYLDLLTEARLISSALNLGEQRTTNYVHHIIYYLEKKDFRTATSYLPELQHLADSLVRYEDSTFAILPLDMEALIYQTAGDYESAIPPGERALAIALRLGEVANLTTTYEQLLELYELTGRYREGFDLIKTYTAYREDNFSNEKRLLVSQLNERFRTSEKERLINQQRKALANARQRFFLLTAASLIVGGLLFLVVMQYRKINRTNAELSSLSEKTIQQNDRLNTLLGELHHRVKNNLQLISSLLRLQARKTTDRSIKSALSVGQRRVEAMSIIHQRLYQQENLTVVNLQSAFGELIQRTDFAYRPGQTPITADVQLDKRHLDATQAVPLTLIVNELVTNSFKYAFTELESPAITMRLVELTPGNLKFSYSDNGPGIVVNEPPSSGFGTQLIHSLSGQLGGSNEFRSDNQGAHFELVFPT